MPRNNPSLKWGKFILIALSHKSLTSASRQARRNIKALNSDIQLKKFVCANFGQLEVI